jgi:hypothetical protein
MVVLFLIFWGLSILYSIMVIPSHSPTVYKGWFPFYHIFSNTCCFFVFLLIPNLTSMKWYLILVLICTFPITCTVAWIWCVLPKRFLCYRLGP